MNNLIIVVPCFNEEAVLCETTKQLTVVLNTIIEKKKANECQILYVDDGSSDDTWQIIDRLNHENHYVRGLKLAHNVGHQNALWAGMEWACTKCDAIVSIDADLQHDVFSIIEMVDKYNEGFEVVYGVRKDRQTDSAFKKKSAVFFYTLMQRMGVDIIKNHADFRLLGHNALKALMSYPERNIFVRGMVKALGFKSTTVYFECHDRFAGESKYTLSKMFNFAVDGITSFSVQPLRLIAAIGFIMTGLSFAAIIYALIVYIVGAAIKGWTTLLLSVWFIGGLLLLSMGILGEYVGKIYKEVKRRPRYIIEKDI